MNMISNYSRVIKYDNHNLIFHTLKNASESISTDLSFFVVLEGEGLICGKKYKSGDLIACFSGSYLSFTPDKETHAIHLFPDKRLFTDLMARELASVYLIDCEYARRDMLSSCLDCFQAQAEPENRNAHESITPSVKSLVKRIIDFLDKDYLCLETIVSNKHNHPFFQSFIDKAVLKMSRADIAEEMKLSPSYLTRQLKKIIGCSPKRYLELLKAYQAIENYTSETSFTSLAHEEGYSDQSHFIKSFKKLLGTTPRKFFK